MVTDIDHGVVDSMLWPEAVRHPYTFIEAHLKRGADLLEPTAVYLYPGNYLSRRARINVSDSFRVLKGICLPCTVS